MTSGNAMQPGSSTLKEPYFEVSLRDIVRIGWQSRWWVVLAAVVAGAAAATYAFASTVWFTADVVIESTDKRSTGAGLGQLSGIAGLVGLNLGSAGGSESIAILKSRRLARKFIESEGLTDLILKRASDNPLSFLLGGNRSQPDIRDAIKFFDEKIRTVSEDKKSGLTTVSIRWTDPKLAAEWANKLIEQVNDEARAQALELSGRNLTYLQSQLAVANVPSLQQAIGRIVESEMQTSMLAKGNREYAFKVIDPATPPRLKSEPKRGGVIILGVLLGAFSMLAWRVARVALAAHR